MLQTDERITTLLDAAIQEMELLAQMSADITGLRDAKFFVTRVWRG